MIVDGHCHAGPGDLLTGPWDTSAPLGAYMRRAAEAGIKKTIVFAPFHSDNHVANANTARIVERSPGRLIGFAFVNTRADRGRIGHLVEEAVRKYDFRGIKAHRAHGGPVTRELCDVARAFGMPVLFDVAGKPEVIDLLAPQYRDVSFIVPHLGSFADDWNAHIRVTDQITRHPNVYADTSGVRRFDYLVDAVKRGAVRKLIFGSDGPWLHPGLELVKIRLLRLAREDEAAVCGGTILSLLRGAKERSLFCGRADQRHVILSQPSRIV
ncbi:MAG TPA: amidohydrolase family protein [Candidatus Acidoferrales bacterium]|nr:amidohydrolase family protein [Candidatus Acidoferrales bacterium]